MIILNEQIAKVRPILYRFYAGSELILLCICPPFGWLYLSFCDVSFESLSRDGNEQKKLEFLFDLGPIDGTVQFCYGS